jgi:hypothetical protein
MPRVTLIFAMFVTALGIPSLKAQQITCTPSVSSDICKQFDSAFGQTSLWPKINFTKSVDVVVVDAAQFKAERSKLDATIDATAKNRKTIGDINRANGREAGGGVFDHEILECTGASTIRRVVISTEAINDGFDTPTAISHDLLFYVIGYDQGLLQGLANAAH